MARKKTSGERIEPSFEQKRGGKSRRGIADERVVGQRTSAKRAKNASGRKSTRGRRGKKAAGQRSLAVRMVRGALYWSLVLAIWGGIAVAGIVAWYGARMPNASTWAIPDRPPNVRIVSVKGDLMANRGATGGEALALSQMSPYIPEAVIAIEDRRYFYHFGIDPIGLARAVITNLMTGHTVQGGSTITQQLAKNLFLSPERTIERKVQEVLLSFWLEHKFSKDQILEMYLNRVYFGSGAYGVEAASRRYFTKSARDVSLHEAALLAGLLKAPSRLSPARNPDLAEERAQVVLDAMQRSGFITDSEQATAISSPQIRAKSYWTGSENYVADLVMKQVPGLIGDITEDVIVDTTIDFGLQRAAEKAVRGELDEKGDKYGVSEGALVAIDGTGAVRAMIGGRNYAGSQFNRAALAKRQPGSAFKPFVYAAALEQGRTPASVRNDAPVRIGKWTPENYDNKYRGEVTLQTALEKSLNTIAAQLVMEVGPGNVIKMAHRLGIESALQANASISLGTSEVSLTELTSAYAPFMNGGYKATPHIIRRITSLEGKVLFENTYDNPPRVLRPDVVAMMNHMLVGVVENGTGKKAKLGNWQVAGKTGTTQSYRDALFVGYTANLAVGVWFGNDDGSATKKVTGGNLPAETWNTFMTAAHKGLPAAVLPYYPPEPFEGENDRLLESGFPSPPVTQDQNDGQPSADGFAPPADVGPNDVGKRTTLLDIILGN